MEYTTLSILVKDVSTGNLITQGVIKIYLNHRNNPAIIPISSTAPLVFTIEKQLSYKLQILVPHYENWEGEISPSLSTCEINLVSLAEKAKANKTINISSEENTGSISRAFPTSTGNRGYFFNGLSNSQYLTSISELNFTTRTNRDLSSETYQSRSSLSSISSLDGIYLAGGENQLVVSHLIENFKFSTEISRTIASILTQPIMQHSAVWNSTNGYHCHGYDGSSPVSSIDALNFSTEITQLLSTYFNMARSQLASTQSTAKGYLAGGFDSIPFNVLEDLDFTTLNTQILTATLVVPRSGLTSVTSTYKGYFAGGTYYSSAEIDALDMITETSLDTASSLSYDRPTIGVYSLAYGYFAGGPVTATIDELNFVNESLVVLASSLAYSRTNGIGGQNNSSVPIMPTPTPSTTNTSTLSNTPSNSGTPSNSPVTPTPSNTNTLTATPSRTPIAKGYFAGGLIHPGDYDSTRSIDTLDLESEVCYVSSLMLDYKTYDMTSTQYASKGYLHGGTIQGNSRLTSDRINFYPETITRLNQLLSVPRSSAAAVNSNVKGYIAGGAKLINTIRSYMYFMEGVDTSTETRFNPNLAIQQGFGSVGLSSNLYGYFCGSISAMAGLIEKLDFSNETLSTCLSVINAENSLFLTATNSAYVGYLAESNRMFKLSFSTDSISSISTSSVLGDSEATLHTPFMGYFAGGANLAEYLHDIHRFNFQIEADALLSAYLSSPRRALTGLASETLLYPPPTQTPTPSTTETQSNSPTPSNTQTPSPTTTSTPSETPTQTPTTTLTESPTETPSTTSTLTESPSQTPTPSTTQTESPTPSTTLTESSSPTPTPSTTSSESCTPTPTPSTTQTETATPTPSTTSTLTESPTQSPTPSTTETESCTPSPTPSTTETLSNTPTPTPTSTITESPTQTPTTTSTSTESPTPTPSTTSTLTETPTNTPSSTASPTSSMPPLASRVSGIFAGGYNITAQTKMDRFIFITETMEALSRQLDMAKSQTASVSSNLSGYLAGGYAYTYLSTISMVDLDDFFTGPLINQLSVSVRSGYGMQQAQYGYIANGEQGYNSYSSAIARITFINNVVTTLTATTLESRDNALGFNALVLQKGFGAAGLMGINLWVDTVDSLDYSTETTNTTSYQVTQSRSSGTSMDDSANQTSYLAGGKYISGYLQNLEKVIHSSQTTSLLSSVLHRVRTDMASVYNSLAAYISGGYTTNGNYLMDNVERLEYSTETVTIIYSSLSIPRRELSGVQPL